MGFKKIKIFYIYLYKILENGGDRGIKVILPL